MLMPLSTWAAAVPRYDVRDFRQWDSYYSHVHTEIQVILDTSDLNDQRVLEVLNKILKDDAKAPGFFQYQYHKLKGDFPQIDANQMFVAQDKAPRHLVCSIYQETINFLDGGNAKGEKISFTRYSKIIENLGLSTSVECAARSFMDSMDRLIRNRKDELSDEEYKDFVSFFQSATKNLAVKPSVKSMEVGNVVPAQKLSSGGTKDKLFCYEGRTLFLEGEWTEIPGSKYTFYGCGSCVGLSREVRDETLMAAKKVFLASTKSGTYLGGGGNCLLYIEMNLGNSSNSVSVPATGESHKKQRIGTP